MSRLLTLLILAILTSVPATYLTHMTLGWGDLVAYDPRTQTARRLIDSAGIWDTGLIQPHGIAFDPSGTAYVGSNAFSPFQPDPAAAIMRYDAGSQRLAPFADPPDRQKWFAPIGFGPDGHLYVAQDFVGIHRFDGTTGQHLALVVPGDDSPEFR